jgi:cysteine synthase A
MPRAIAAEPQTYYTNQIYNRDSLVGYASIGRELLAQVPDGIDGFAAAVGGAGMLIGVAGVLRGSRPSTRIVALDPASAPMRSAGRAGSHRVEGIGIGVVPPLLDKALYDEARAIDEGQPAPCVADWRAKKGSSPGPRPASTSSARSNSRAS